MHLVKNCFYLVVGFILLIDLVLFPVQLYS
jgi:hypothetical protein